MSEYGPGTIGMVTGEVTRFAAAHMAFMQLAIPPGTQVSWARGINLAANLNRAIAQGGGDWIWLMGDDHLFAPDLLVRLLAHELPMVAPVCCLRSPPYCPVVYRSEHADGSFEVWPADELPTTGIHAVAACSMAGMVIRTEALKALTPPYFEVGQIKSDELGEDLYFFHKAKLSGLTPYLDCDARIGHITPTTLWPVLMPDGGWSVSLDPTCTIPAPGEGPCPL